MTHHVLNTPNKKRQLGEKMSPQAIEPRFGQNAGVDWQIAMQLADKSTQQFCPHHKIHQIVLCRGTDRYVGPNKSMLPGVAPVRRQICIRRHSTEFMLMIGKPGKTCHIESFEDPQCQQG